MDYKGRIVSFQKLLKENKIASAFLTRRCVLGYFTGAFVPWSSALFIPQEGEPILITMAADIERLNADSFVKKFEGWSFGVEKSMVSIIANIIKDYKLETATIGFELGTSTDIGVLSAYEYLEIKELYPNIKIANVLNHTIEMQLIKTEEEIELMRRAAEAVDLGMKYAHDALSIGMTEIELAGYAELGMRKAGTMFNWCVTGTEVGAGYRQGYMLGATVIPGHKRIQYGELVTIDIHSMYDLYISDLALNAIIGKPTVQQRKLADDWKEIVDFIISVIKPGAVCNDMANAIINKSVKMGIENKIMKMFSHGLGLDARIPPTIQQGNNFQLKENMIVEAVCQMTEPQVGGMRLEVPVLVTKYGAELLCKTPLDLYVKEAF